jgi:hypothetical protein
VGKSKRIQNRIESRVGPSRIALRKRREGKEQRKGWAIGIKLFVFIFLELLFILRENVIRNRKARRAKKNILHVIFPKF